MEKIQTIDIERDEFVMPRMKRCDTCTHSTVCEAYSTLQKQSDIFNERFPYTQFPAMAIALAVMCKEYKELSENEELHDYKSLGSRLGCG